MKIRSVIVPVEVWVNWPTTRLSWPIIKRERNAYRLFPSFLVILDRGVGRRKENFDASQRRGFVHSVTSTLIVSSGGGETEAMKSGRHFSLNIFDVEVDAVCINLSWLFTYKKLHENTLFSNIYIYYTNQLYYRVYPMRIRCGSKNRTCVQNCTKSGMESVAWSIVSRMFFRVRV